MNIHENVDSQTNANGTPTATGELQQDQRTSLRESLKESMKESAKESLKESFKESGRESGKEQAPDLSKLYSKALADGEARAQKQLLKDLQKLGFEIKDGADWREALALKLATPHTTEANATRESELLEQVESWRTKHDEVQQELKSFMVQTEVTKLLQKKEVVDREDVLALFNAHFQVDVTKEGIRVYDQSGHLILNGKTAEPLTLEETLDVFLQSKPHLVRAAARSVNMNTIPQMTSLTGAPVGFKERYLNATPDERRKLRDQMKGWIVK